MPVGVAVLVEEFRTIQRYVTLNFWHAVQSARWPFFLAGNIPRLPLLGYYLLEGIMQLKTTSGSAAAGLAVIGTGLALALPDAKWIGWLLVVMGLFVFAFDIRIERGHIAAGSPKSAGDRFKRMWPQYLMILSGCLFFVGFIGFLQLNVTTESQNRTSTEVPPPIAPSVPPHPKSPPSPPSPPDKGATTLIEPPPSMRRNSDGSERIFVQVSPSDLMGEFKTHTEEHAKEIVRRYLGKWMALKGTVYNVSTDNGGGVQVDVGGNDALSVITNGVLQLHFALRFREKLLVLKRGQTINAVCRIDDIEEVGLALAQCEIVDP